MIHITYPDGYFKKQRDLTIGKDHPYRAEEHPVDSSGHWIPAPGSHHGEGGGPHYPGPSGQHNKTPDGKSPSPGKAPSDSHDTPKPKEPDRPFAGRGSDKVKAAGPIPKIESKADFDKAKEYMDKLGTKLTTFDSTKPGEVQKTMEATANFVEKTGLSPREVVLTNNTYVKQRFGSRVARVASAFFAPTSHTVYSSKVDKLSGHINPRSDEEINGVRSFTMSAGIYDDATTAFWHEFGHDIDFVKNPDMINGKDNPIHNRYKLPSDKEFGGHSSADLMKQGMSKYGLTMRDEFVAEYITGHMQGMHFGPLVHDAYDKMGGPDIGFRNHK